MEVISNQDKFLKSCKDGNLEMAQWLYSLDNDNIINSYKYKDEIISDVCENGHLEVAQWLFYIGYPIENISFIRACQRGHLEVAQWLYSLGVDIHSNSNKSFCYACRFGKLEIAQWLWSLGGFDKEKGFDCYLVNKNTPQPIKDWLATLE
jgi:hypothetical protein